MSFIKKYSSKNEYVSALIVKLGHKFPNSQQSKAFLYIDITKRFPEKKIPDFTNNYMIIRTLNNGALCST